MTKKQRSDYTLLGHFEFAYKGESYYVRVMVDPDELLAGQGELARASKQKRNKQDYGPFRVVVTATGADGAVKQKRKRKQ